MGVVGIRSHGLVFVSKIGIGFMLFLPRDAMRKGGTGTSSRPASLSVKRNGQIIKLSRSDSLVILVFALIWRYKILKGTPLRAVKYTGVGKLAL